MWAVGAGPVSGRKNVSAIGGCQAGGGDAPVVEVEPGSPADAAGLRAGDIIEQVGEHAVAGAAEATAKLSAARLDQGVRLRVKRGEYGRFVVLRGRAK